MLDIALIKEQDYRESFPTNEDVVNIEFGAGKGYFGKSEFNPCYQTDKFKFELDHVCDVEHDDLERLHALDCSVDFFEVNSRKFERLIFCNPYGFGFSKRYQAFDFLQQAEKLLNTNGEILVLGQQKNGDAIDRKAKKYLAKYNEEKNKTIWTFDREIPQEEITRINEKHSFRRTDNQPIYVQFGYYLKCLSND